MRHLGIFALVLYAFIQLSGPGADREYIDQASKRKPAKAVQCVYNSGDLPAPIIGYGSSLNEARADASHKCFDVRMDFYEMKNPNAAYNMDQGYAIANACTNIRCAQPAVAQQ
jgi:hypothetical protein